MYQHTNRAIFWLYVFDYKQFNITMANLIKSTRGLDIPISGAADKVLLGFQLSEIVAIVPDHYHGITPKLLVKEGEQVKAGTPIFYSKANERVKFVSPVSGKIVAINRGERRKILNVLVERDAEIAYQAKEVPSLSTMQAEEIKELLLQSGLWAYIKQRPYDIIADPNSTPKAIFISAFDSAPLAPSCEFVLSKQMNDFQKGIDALAKLTTGKVHLGVRNVTKLYADLKNVEINQYHGPHPIGNVGVQINKINPINKGEIVWTMHAHDVLFIGRLLHKGIVDLKRKIALTGPEVTSPSYYETLPGCQIDKLIKGKITSNITPRYIAGNVLTGTKVTGKSYLDPYATQITVIKEGNDVHELFGWAMPRFRKFSVSGTYFSNIMKKVFGIKTFDFDARVLGGKRAIIMSGEYDKVLPMDIYPEFLIKAMITGNIDKMEALGAYEIAPEDVALCEFVCTSKLPLQKIVRESLDLMRKELE